jgi:electron transfer flavoprotein alpha/beta subunit
MTVLSVLGRGDDSVVQTATQLGETIAVLIAPAAPAAERLSALGRAGVSRVIHIWDEALSEPLRDSLEYEPTLVALLTGLLRLVEVKTLVVGDGRHAWLAPALAEDLDLPHVTSVLHAVPATASPSGNEDILIQRRCLHGVQRLRGPARCVLAVLPGGPLPVLPLPKSARGVPRTAPPAVETWDLRRLGLTADDLPRPLLKLQQPERTSPFPGRSFENVAELSERLRLDGLAPLECFAVPSESTEDVQQADDLVIDGGD